MAQDWEYAKATKWIAEHGGPQKAFDVVKNYYMNEGFHKGADSKNLIIVLVGGTCLLAGFGGKYVYDKIREKKALKAKNKAVEQEIVKQAEVELISAMTHESTQDSQDGCEINDEFFDSEGMEPSILEGGN